MNSPESQPHAPPGTPLDGTLQEFLAAAYDATAVQNVLEKRLASGVSISKLTPQRAHLTKDGRLMVVYRMQLFHPRAGLCEVPVFLHHTEQSRASASKTYAATEPDVPGERDPLLRRLYIKTGSKSFVSVFPLDPELRTQTRLLKPREMLACYNDELRGPGTEPATAVDVKLLGYRPERRVVLKVRALSQAGDANVVVKLYRRQEAQRVWDMCQGIGPAIRKIRAVALPLAYSPSYSGLSYPFQEGETLHHLLEHSWATEDDLHRAGQLLRRFHTAVKLGNTAVPGLRQFTFPDEWEILNRWRRFLKQSSSPHAGFLGHYARVLNPANFAAPEPDALVHRDFYPKQLLVHPWTRDQSLVDLDTVAHGPAAVDVGNFLAHLQLTSNAHTEAYRNAFLVGYGDTAPKAVALFELTSTLRLFCLALVAPPVRGLLKRLRARARELEQSVL